MTKLSKTAISVAAVLAASGIGSSALADTPEGKCKVTVNRSQPAGVFDVTRLVAKDGDCICYVYTGPPTQADSIENSIDDLQRSRTCPTARTAALAKPAGAAAGGSVMNIAAVAAAAAGIVAIAAEDDRGDGPVSP